MAIKFRWDIKIVFLFLNFNSKIDLFILLNRKLVIPKLFLILKTNPLWIVEQELSCIIFSSVYRRYNMI